MPEGCLKGTKRMKTVRDSSGKSIWTHEPHVFSPGLGGLPVLAGDRSEKVFRINVSLQDIVRSPHAGIEKPGLSNTPFAVTGQEGSISEHWLVSMSAGGLLIAQLRFHARWIRRNFLFAAPSLAA